MKSKKLFAFMLGATFAVACAGDGTGLDENGNPFTPTSGVDLSISELALPIGAAFVLGVTTTDNQGNTITDRPVTWASTDAAVATVDIAGVVTAVGVGFVTVTATSDSATDGVDVVVVASARLTADVQPIFSANCAFSGCHGGATPQLGQNLSVGNAFSSVVNVPSMQVPALNRITPGDPARSYLLHKIRGTFGLPSVGGTGGRMPLGGASLPDDEINVIRAWVQTGALNN